MITKMNKLFNKLFNKKNIKRKATTLKKTYNWLIEFSKKVVVGIFVIYIVNYIICWTLSFLSGLNGWSIQYIDTFITSTNETTQIVLGGYLFKAMAENIIKVRNSNSSNKDMDNVNNDELTPDNSDDDSSF